MTENEGELLFTFVLCGGLGYYFLQLFPRSTPGVLIIALAGIP
jgi:hypothetical protein